MQSAKAAKAISLVLVFAFFLSLCGCQSNKNSNTLSMTKSNKSITAADPTAKPTAAPTIAPTSTPMPTPLLQSGSKGDEVVTLQKLLISYKYLSGMASGTFDKDTASAVKDFQVNNSLSETGKCDEAVWQKITSGHAKYQATVYKSKKGKVYHSNSTCSGMKTATSMTLSDAIRKGLKPCSHCH